MGGLTEVVYWDTEAKRAVWLIHIVAQTADDLGMNVPDTVDLLDTHGIIKGLLSDSDVWGTQDYQFLSGEVREILAEAGALPNRVECKRGVDDEKRMDSRRS